MSKAWQHSWRVRLAVAGPALACVLLAAPDQARAQGSKADYERAADLSRKFSTNLFRNRVQVDWLPGNTSLWYEVKTGRDTKEIISVNAITGERKVLQRAPVEAK